MAVPSLYVSENRNELFEWEGRGGRDDRPQNSVTNINYFRNQKR